MFKKNVDAKALQRLSGADKKKLRRTAKQRFPQASDDDLDAILPPKVEITVAKYPSRTLVYGIEGELPMLFDIDGRGHELFPTVYALWKVPYLLPAFTLKGGEVSHFILGGADLMFPGISVPPEGLPSFQAGQPWASADGRYVPNEGFYDDMVIEDPNFASASQHIDSSEEPSEGKQDKAAVDVSECLTEDHAINSETIENVTASTSELNLPQEKTTKEQTEEKEHQHLSTEEIDSLLDICLLQALHMNVKDKDLPMPGSILWSNHILPCRPPGVTLDIKKSSHKKLSKWLQSKSSSGLISVKEDKHKKEVMLIGISRKHPDYTAFKHHKRVQEPVEQHDNIVADGSSTKQLEVDEIYKPSSHVNPIFLAVDADTGKYYSASEAFDVVFRYVEKENLVKQTDKAKVILDATLCDALYKGAVKKGSAYPSEIHKKDLGSTFINRMQIHHRVARGNEVAIRKGAIRTVQIMTERRQGNKKMTRVSGLECFLLDADSLASELQKKFACSTTTAELPGIIALYPTLVHLFLDREKVREGKKGQHEVLIQGGVIENLAKHLVDHHGVPKRYIEVKLPRPVVPPWALHLLGIINPKGLDRGLVPPFSSFLRAILEHFQGDYRQLKFWT
ncbi:unnamed protein product [Triticum turgidum subsp. durum]|uniref:SUI1 domain-containing protein n=1 Tax=Triticum turgidum subsp. durum TaxID=4567 RepID=A0A9R0ZXZ3_TRITD|nr:unnamed protein product [Triticum turgidum subsp. durum]